MKTSNRKSLKKDSYAADLLLKIAKQFDNVQLGMSKPGLVFRFGYDGTREFLLRKEQYEKNQTLKYLEERKLIKTREIADGINIQITGLGVIESLRLKALNADLLPEGEICMVIFDIPESQSTVRKQIRRFLSKVGFIPIQRSVWISPFDAGPDLSKLFIDKYESGWVQIFRARREK